MIVIKSQAEIDRMRVPCRMVAEFHARIREIVKPGVTTLELDSLAEQYCKDINAVPAFKGYGGFPFSICASPNEAIVHGFANDTPLRDGDILSIDFGVLYDGFYGDAAITLPVGNVSAEKQRLMEVTEASLYAGLDQIRPGVHLSDVSAAIQKVAEAAGFSVVREFVGHGIGREMHEDPQIPNYGKPGNGPILKKGMTLAVEPMINAGTRHIKILADGWTAVTKDGRPSAHFEHTVAVTEDGYEVLTCV
ncbi:MAG: type I methionyl aminopeptidase [Desulfuromonadaceae bacterium]|nr:type I methionyl aminopeptidase [Desulfuromonadaceae bacterium]